MTWMVLNARWRASQGKSWWTLIWCCQSSQLHGIGCWKPAFSCPSQEWGLYSFAVCTRLWQYVQRKRASNEQQHGRPITTQVLGRGTQSQSDRWDCLKFYRCHKPQRSRLPKTKSPWWGSGQEHMDLLYGKEVTMARAGTLPDFLYQKEIEVGERIDLSSQCGNHRHQLSIQHHWCRRRKLPCTIQAVMKKFVKLKILWRRVLGTSDLRNQQITQDVNSLVGVTSRFGRPVRVNSRFVL